MSEKLLTISELAEAANAVLEGGHVRPASGRAKDKVSERMVRYYATAGILDRPAATRDRVAFYGRRHLLQILATKRLQEAGVDLARVTGKLSGMALEGLLEVSGFKLDELPEIDDVSLNGDTPRARESFWAAPLASGAGGCRIGKQVVPEMRTTIALGGVLVTFEARRGLTEADMVALGLAAKPLLEVLDARDLLIESTSADAL